ncbi:MAG: hypothetical protein F7C38_06560 [Desulfurococcales archaeon]|nr:hypothetical protein [Desulfurococcales archaeon]
MTFKETIHKESADTIYIIVSPTARTDTNYPLRGYAGPSGRIDEIARSMLSIARSKSLLVAVLLGPPNPPATIVYRYREGCRFSSEREALQYIRKSVQGKSVCIDRYAIGVRDVVSIISKAGFETILLAEDGEDISGLPRVKPRAYLLGAQIDIPEHIINDIRNYIDAKASIGPLSYQTSQVIAYLEWEAEACN